MTTKNMEASASTNEVKVWVEVRTKETMLEQRGNVTKILFHEGKRGPNDGLFVQVSMPREALELQSETFVDSARKAMREQGYGKKVFVCRKQQVPGDPEIGSLIPLDNLEILPSWDHVGDS
ncbi:MAG: hypothetical protein OEY44_00575 [Candidatus Peregrinibacteria bacterium]|nr:hypothetical protein [Candidatus Peregrinibacteria bacterium]